MRFWTTLCILLVLTETSLWAASYKLQQRALSAHICIERLEESGIVNILPARVVFDNHQALSLVGGQAACIIVGSGSYSFVVQSSDPYSLESTNQEAWTSKEIEVRVAAGDVLTFQIAPRSKDATYVGGWIVKSTPE